MLELLREVVCRVYELPDVVPRLDEELPPVLRRTTSSLPVRLLLDEVEEVRPVTTRPEEVRLVLPSTRRVEVLPVRLAVVPVRELDVAALPVPGRVEAVVVGRVLG